VPRVPPAAGQRVQFVRRADARRLWPEHPFGVRRGLLVLGDGAITPAALIRAGMLGFDVAGPSDLETLAADYASGAHTPAEVLAALRR
jgi:hypothetical protein